MAVYLTNGKYYITHSKTGAIIKVDNVEEAQDFYSVERAITQKNKHPGKCAGYYYIDTEKMEVGQSDNVRRKNFTAKERLQIYRKTEGHCYLCGEFVDFDAFEIEHRIPLANGGKNDMDNLFPACHTCNTLKGSIAPADLLEKIKQIYLYQMGKKYNGFRWKIVHRLLENLI